MTQVIDVCPVCYSSRGQIVCRSFGWACDDCRRVSPQAAQVEVPRSITEMIADTEAAESAERKQGNGK